MAEQQKYNIFISYSRVNTEFAIQLAKDLKSAGFLVWIDSLNLSAGSRWDAEIEKALSECRIFIVILSRASVLSENIKSDIAFALDNQKLIVPVMLEPVEAPLRLRRLAVVDMVKQPYPAGLEELVKLLHQSPGIQISGDVVSGNSQVIKKYYVNMKENAVRKFGRYEIKSEIGRGGLGTVYHGVDLSLGREVAIKVLPSELARSDPQFKLRFEREGKNILSLQHPAIVPVYDLGEQDGQFYLVMDFMPGGNLRGRIAQKRFNLQETAQILEPIASGLDYAYKAGFVHRDLKPGNILFDRENFPRITDIIDSRLFQGTTGTGNAAFGTPVYMAPEEVQGGQVDGRTHIYSLGVILFEMLVGHPPFAADTPMAVMVKHISEPVPDIRKINPNLPEGIQPVIEKALAKKPDDRFQTAIELVDALKALSSNKPAEEDKAAAVTKETEAERAQRLQAAIEANRLVNNRSQAVFNDRAQGDDQLGIKDEVEALAETLLLRDVEPPVAVGVMGGWGSGKSFVMYLINQYVQSTRAKKVKKGWPTDGNDKDPEIPAFVGHIYQVNFNAWTYAKSDLWASLMDTIFSGLSQQMQLERLLAHKDFAPEAPAPTAEQIKACTLTGGDAFKKIYQETLQIDQDKDLLPWRKNLVHWSQHLLKETLLWNIMRGQQVETLEKLKDTEEQLKQLKQRRAQFEKNHPLPEITATALDAPARQAYFQSLKGYLLAFVTDELSQAAKDELGKQGVSEDEVDKYLEQARGLAGGFNTLLAAYRRNRIYSLWTLLFLVVTLAVPYVWSTYAPDSIYKWITQAVSLLVTLLPLLSVLIPWLQKSVKFGQEAKKILDGAYAAQQAKQAEQITSSTEKPLSQKISELQKEISTGSVAAYDNLIGLLETQAEEQRQQIGPSAKYANLMEFVQSRLDAATYENQLGLMHQVRRDIDELTYSLVDNADPDVFPRGRPRVILYIDDLDRCPPSRVVEMLEAVQLLLSTKLFIVILGLDTRYVTRALEKEYKEILQHEGDPSGLDYIEKIIQIPYRVRPIEPGGLRKYLEKQMDVEKPVQVAAQTPVVGPAQVAQNIALQATQPADATQLPAESAKPIQTPAETSTPESSMSEHKEEPKPPEIELPAAVIQFKREDLEDLTVCCQKIDLTPRSIKRLVNVFKLIKIFWFRADKNAGFAERDRPRPVKQAAISLLALSSAYPEVMREVFVHLESLYRQGLGRTELYDALNNINLPPGSANELAWQLQKYKADLAALKAIKGEGQDKFGQLTLQAFNLSTFNIVRSFSFVGDPVFWTDGSQAASKPRRAAPSKRRAKENQEHPETA